MIQLIHKTRSARQADDRLVCSCSLLGKGSGIIQFSYDLLRLWSEDRGQGGEGGDASPSPLQPPIVLVFQHQSAHPADVDDVGKGPRGRAICWPPSRAQRRGTAAKQLRLPLPSARTGSSPEIMNSVIGLRAWAARASSTRPAATPFCGSAQPTMHNHRIQTEQKESGRLRRAGSERPEPAPQGPGKIYRNCGQLGRPA